MESGLFLTPSNTEDGNSAKGYNCILYAYLERRRFEFCLEFVAAADDAEVAAAAAAVETIHPGI